MLKIERLEIDDDRLDEIQALDRATLPEAPPSPDTEWWGCWRDGELIAYAGARMLSDASYFMSRAGVVPAARGAGLQKRLIRARVRRGYALGALRVATYTLPHNVASSNSLIACGFRTYTPHSEYAGSGAIYWIHRRRSASET